MHVHTFHCKCTRVNAGNKLSGTCEKPKCCYQPPTATRQQQVPTLRTNTQALVYLSAWGMGEWEACFAWSCRCVHACNPNPWELVPMAGDTLSPCQPQSNPVLQPICVVWRNVTDPSCPCSPPNNGMFPESHTVQSVRRTEWLLVAAKCEHLLLKKLLCQQQRSLPSSQHSRPPLLAQSRDGI